MFQVNFKREIEMKKLLICLLILLTPFLSVSEENNEPLKIFITGSLSPQGMERIGKPISTINKEKILKKHQASLGEVLNGEPGISGTNFGPGASRPIIRGQGKERVRVLENGLENGDVSASSDDHAVTSEPLTTERIDVIRGPSTLMFGGQAIGGVVNVIDGSIAEENIGKDFTGKLNITAGDSASDEFSGSTILQGQAGSLNWYFSGFGRSTNDIEIPGFAESSLLREMEEDEHDDEEDEDHEEEDHEDEEVKDILENSDTESYGFKAGLSHVWDSGFIGFAVKNTGSEYGIPGGHLHMEEEEDEEEEGDVRIDLEQTRIESRGAVHLHQDFLDTVRFGFSFSDYEHKELEGSSVGTLYERESFEGRVLLTHHHEDYLEGGFGLQINYDDLEVTGDEAFIPSTKTFNPAIFLVEDFALNNNLILQLGGRYENSSVDPFQMSSENFNVFSASSGLIWHNNTKEYSTAFNFSYSERAPNATELFADGAHIASQIFEIGNSDIEKEGSLGAEFILRKLTGPTRGSFTAFIQDYSDYINLSARGGEMEGFSVFEYENIDARFWGFEADLKQDLINSKGHLLTLNLGFDSVRARDTNNNQNLPRITPIRTKIGLSYSHDIFNAYLDSIIVEEQDKIAEFELPTDGYALLNAGVNVNLTRNEAQSIELFFRGTNLTNEEARVHTSFLKDQAPLRGRAFFAGLTANF